MLVELGEEIKRLAAVCMRLGSRALSSLMRTLSPIMKSILSGVPTCAGLVSSGMAGVALPIEFIELSRMECYGV